MSVRLHPHARERIEERGATFDEVVSAINKVSGSRRASVDQSITVIVRYY